MGYLSHVKIILRWSFHYFLIFSKTCIVWWSWLFANAATILIISILNYNQIMYKANHSLLSPLKLLLQSLLCQWVRCSVPVFLRLWHHPARPYRQKQTPRVSWEMLWHRLPAVRRKGKGLMGWKSRQVQRVLSKISKSHSFYIRQASFVNCRTVFFCAATKTLLAQETMYFSQPPLFSSPAYRTALDMCHFLWCSIFTDSVAPV